MFSLTEDIAKRVLQYIAAIHRTKIIRPAITGRIATGAANHSAEERSVY